MLGSISIDVEYIPASITDMNNKVFVVVATIMAFCLTVASHERQCISIQWPLCLFKALYRVTTSPILLSLCAGNPPTDFPQKASNMNIVSLSQCHLELFLLKQYFHYGDNIMQYDICLTAFTMEFSTIIHCTVDIFCFIIDTVYIYIIICCVWPMCP